MPESKVRLPEATRIADPELRAYLNELVKAVSLQHSVVVNNEDNITFQAARKTPFITTNTSLRLGPNSAVVLADATTSALAFALPNPLDVKGGRIEIKKTAGANTVTVSGIGPEFPAVVSTYGSFFSDGANFFLFYN